MKKKIKITIIILAVVFAALFFLWLPFPLIRINHIPVQGSINMSSFLDAGCVIGKQYSQQYDTSYLNCSSVGFESRFGCWKIITSPQFLSGLGYPIALCMQDPRNRSMNSGQVIYSAGCMLRTDIAYIVFNGNDFTLLKTKEEFRNFFIPLDSSEKALSYTAAITGKEAKYGFGIIGGRYLSFVIEDSYAKEVDGSYIVHLYGYEACGCGLHPYYTLDYSVAKNGTVQELSRQNIWEDPFFNACID